MRSLAAIHLVIGVIVAATLRGSFFHMLVLAGFTLLVLAPVAAVIAMGAFIGTVRKKSFAPNWIKPALKAWLVFAASTGLSWIVGVSIHAFQVSAVERYVQRVLPVLDGIKKREGSYPKELPETILGRPPFLLRTGRGYFSDGASFRFEYWDTAGLMEGYAFDSETRNWYYND